MPQHRVSTIEGEALPWPPGGALDRALAAGLRPPSLPLAFHATLRDAVARLATQRNELHRESARRALEAEYAQRALELRADYVRVRRNTAALALATAFAAGAAASVFLPWIAEVAGSDVSTVTMWFATLAGLAITAAVPLRNSGLLRLR